MDKVDGKQLRDLKQWRCSRNKNHILGVIERMQVSVEANGSSLKYHTTRLSIFRVAVDLGAEVPAEIEVSGAIDGKIMSLVWRCSVPGCGCMREWHPDEGAIELLQSLYGKG
jgi:hypothetical protein